jgi:hypothetical protein
MQITEAHCENGPLHGRTLVLKELLEMQLRGGFYILDEHQGATAQAQKCSMYTWLGAEDWNVVVHIGDTTQALTVDSARIDRKGVTWMRLRKVGIEPELYALWKKTADRHIGMSLIFRGEKYNGRADVVGKNDIDGYMFLHFQGEKAE